MGHHTKASAKPLYNEPDTRSANARNDLYDTGKCRETSLRFFLRTAIGKR